MPVEGVILSTRIRYGFCIHKAQFRDQYCDMSLFNVLQYMIQHVSVYINVHLCESLLKSYTTVEQWRTLGTETRCDRNQPTSPPPTHIKRFPLPSQWKQTLGPFSMRPLSPSHPFPEKNSGFQETTLAVRSSRGHPLDLYGVLVVTPEKMENERKIHITPMHPSCR